MVKEFYKKKMSAIEDIGVRLDNVEFKEISESDNSFLTGPFDEKEIKDAIWNCDSHKSPGPDGVTFSFIKKYWGLLNKEVSGTLKFFHREGKIPKDCNASFLTLIPKSENPQSLEEYRPISLVGCMLKILTKVLSNRIKKVIEKVIDGSQPAFLSNRGLLDSVLVVNEVLDELKRRRKIAWTSWENICQSKKEGGLGIRRIDLFNKALLAKWLWKMETPETGLWREVIESKYGSRRLIKSSRRWKDLTKVRISDQGDN